MADDTPLDQDIHTQLLETYKDLDARITALPTLPASSHAQTITTLLSEISTLSSKLKDATPYLPAYDQRTNATRIQALTSKLSTTRQSLAPKKKFTFSARRKAGQTIGGDLSGSERSPTPTTPAAAAPTEEANVVVAGKRGEVVRPSGSGSLLLSGLRECVVKAAEGLSVGATAIKDVEGSLLVLGGAVESGPAHITGLRRSTVVVSCRQLRLHDAVDVDVYLRCTSRPIIEDCRGVRFAPFGGLEGNLWDKVEDFKWLRMEQSPNWSVLPVEERRTDWEMLEIDDAKVQETLAEVLRKS